MAEVAIGQLLLTSAVATAVSTGIQVLVAEGQSDILNEGPRSSTIPVLDSREGATQNIILSVHNRIGGIVIWLPDFEEIPNEETIGGGGLSGSGPETTNITFEYEADVAFAVAEGPGITIDKIFANGNLIWTPSGVISLAGTDIELIDLGLLFLFGGAGRWMIRAPNAGTDLTQIREGEYVTIQGFTSGHNNGTFYVTKVGVDASSRTFIRYRNYNLLATVEAAGGSVTVDQVALTFLNSVANSFNQYPGGTSDTDNPVDPLIEAREVDLGMVNKTPGYKATAYGVFQGLKLQPFGNRIPQLTFKASNSSFTVEEAILFLLQRVGIDTNEVDASDLSGLSLRGYTLPGPTSLLNALRPILLAYDIIVQQRAEKMFFVQRVNTDTVVVLEDDLLSQEEGKYKLTDVSDSALPQEVTVTFKDVNNELQQGSQSERRAVNNSEEHIINIDVPLALTSAEARHIANRELFRLWQRRQKVTFLLPPKYLGLQEGDYINLIFNDGAVWSIFVNEMTIGNNFIIEVIGEIDDGDPPTITIGEEAVDVTQTVNAPIPLHWSIIDQAPLTDGHESQSGLYFVASRVNPSSTWVGAQGYQSSDDSNFDLAATIISEGRLGITTGILADASPGYWDIESTVNVEVSGALSSTTEINALNGINRAMIGQEVIAFRTATLEADGTYTLSNLLRGLRNTEEFIGTHIARERFVRLTNVFFFAIPSSNISTLNFTKVIAPGSDLVDVQSLSHTYIGGTITPFAPAHLDGFIESDGDIVYSWTRRTRKFHRLFSQVQPGFVDSIQPKYTIRIKDGSTVVRTVAPSVESYLYTSANQTTDGFSASDTVTFEVYEQGDSINGRAASLDVVI